MTKAPKLKIVENAKNNIPDSAIASKSIEVNLGHFDFLFESHFSFLLLPTSMYCVGIGLTIPLLYFEQHFY